MLSSNVRECYDKTARKYAEKFFNEDKHLDKILLQAFVAENGGTGDIIDLGCGPGQTTAFLHKFGAKNVVGTDLSPAMIEMARKLSPDLTFEVADMLNLPYADKKFSAAVAFYAIVHFQEQELTKAFQEISRILVPKGQLLLAFHVGNEVVHLDTFLEQEVNIDFYFWDPVKVIGLANAAGFKMVDSIQRQPYPEVEYQSTRAYLWFEKSAN